MRLLPNVSRHRARTDTVLQMEAVECGAAALAMVLGYHGRLVPLEELRGACGVSRDGSKASNVLKAARGYGLAGKGFKKEPDQLRGLPVPMIVHWNFNHFVVLEGFRKGRAYINDPARGPTELPEAEFDQAYTGIALVFEKGPEFRPGGERPSLVGALRRRLHGSRAALLYAVLAGLALVVPGLVIPTFQKVFVDDVLVKGMIEWLKPLLVVMGACALVNAGITWIQQRHLLRFETKLALDTSARFFWHVLRLPVDFFHQRYAGEIANRVGINDKVARLLSGDLATTALNVLVIAFYAALMVQYDVLLTLIGVVMASLNLAALKYVSRRRVDLNRRLGQDRGKAMGAAMGGLQTIETLKASGAESDFFARWAGFQAKVVNGDQQLQLKTQVLSAVPPLLLAVTSALVLGVGGARVMNGVLSMGMLIAFQSLMNSFISPVNRMVNLGGTVQEVRGDMDRLDDVLRACVDAGAMDRLGAGTATPPDAASVPGPGPEEGPDAGRGSGAGVRLAGHVELRNVTFGYNRLEPPLVRGLNLTIRPGARVALVGGSGSGKSTVSKLVCGLYAPWEGEILFDGRPRHEVARSVMTSSFAAVDQEVFIFEGSVRDNVTLWDTTLSEADVVRAAQDACIHADITARSGAYRATTEEGGRNFSGGQQQRLEIARALAVSPTVLVLDEATSALDPATEQEIDDNLRRRGCTCLIVAHRLSTIRDCDEIIVLDRGQVVQRGTHEAMARVPGPYQSLIAAE
ncbi:NHLP family bacteriocin export ABC transporter peptidase/permease/ATPase [Gemmatimonadetes bacterium T265]|nr:NHLP family bacteriocin export ABC transporter peptidase/permease/ATPase [Gemmatimonadetes bacterium T265]